MPAPSAPEVSDRQRKELASRLATISLLTDGALRDGRLAEFATTATGEGELALAEQALDGIANPRLRERVVLLAVRRLPDAGRRDDALRLARTLPASGLRAPEPAGHIPNTRGF